MFIEFTGVPCSGKSTISHNLAIKLGELGYDVVEIPYRLAHHYTFSRRIFIRLLFVFLFLMNHPIKFITNVLLIKASVINKFNICYIQGIYCLKNKNKIFILDQGLGQGLLSIFENKICNIRELKELIIKMNIKCNTVWQIILSAGKNTIENRAIDRRDKPYFLNKENKEELIHISMRNISTFESFWRDLFSDKRLIKINSEQEIGVIVNEIINRIFS